MAPRHLLNIYNNVNANYDYNLRNNEMQLIYSRTESFRSSFFPASFRLWNKLEPSVRNASSLSKFKSLLCKNRTRKITTLIMAIEKKLHIVKYKNALYT